MNLKSVETSLLGAITLLLGWGIGTLVHEAGHIVAAGALGIPVTLGECTLSTGSVILHGSMTDTQTAVIALAGSIGLVIAGVLLVKLSRAPVVRMVGVIFLCRAWVDVLPIAGYDGGMIAGSAGYLIAALIVIAEILVCGGVIYSELNTYKGEYINEIRTAD